MSLPGQYHEYAFGARLKRPENCTFDQIRYLIYLAGGVDTNDGHVTKKGYS